MTLKSSNIVDGIVSGLKPGITLRDAVEQAEREAAWETTTQAQVIEAMAVIAEIVEEILDAIVEFFEAVVEIITHL